MDDLLAQLKEEFEPKREVKRNSQKGSNKSSVPKPQKPSQSPKSSQSSVSMDQMLDELRAEIESGRGRNKDSQSAVAATQSNSSTNEQNSKYRDRLNVLIEQDYQMQARKREAKLAEIRRKEEARLAEQKRRQQELIEAQKREELRERRRKAAMKEKAQQWLKNLNMRSEEGKWFEEFSYSYEDKLQAAIDYLEAMRESGL